jgi:hypothetical protein
MDKKEKKVRVTIRLDFWMVEALKKLAEQECRTLNQQINYILKKYIDNLESRKTKIGYSKTELLSQTRYLHSGNYRITVPKKHKLEVKLIKNHLLNKTLI